MSTGYVRVHPASTQNNNVQGAKCTVRPPNCKHYCIRIRSSIAPHKRTSPSVNTEIPIGVSGTDSRFGGKRLTRLPFFCTMDLLPDDDVSFRRVARAFTTGELELADGAFPI